MRIHSLSLMCLLAGCAGAPPGHLDAGAGSFSLKAPQGIRAAPGAATFLDVTIERGAGSTEAVSLTAEGAFPATVTMTADAARVRIEVPRGAAPGKSALTLNATSAKGEAQQAVVELEVLEAFKSPSQPVGVSVRLNALFYRGGDLAKVTVDFGATVPPSVLADVVLVSAESQDVERLALTSLGGGRYESSPVPVTASDAPGAPGDQAFTLPPGGVFFAFFAMEGLGATHVSDFGFLEGARAGLPAARIEPGLALSLDEKNPVPGARALGTLLRTGTGPGTGMPIQLATEELIVFHRDQAELARFVEASKGTVLHTQDVEGEVAFSSLVQVDPLSLSPANLALLRGFTEDSGELVTSKVEVQGIYGLALAFRLDGFLVAVNPRLQYQSPPSTRDPERSSLTASMTMRGAMGAATACIPGDPSRRCATNVPALWTYLDLLELDTQRVKVAVLDMGFAPNADFRTNADGGVDQCDVTGRSLRCGPGRALGAPTVGASLVGDRVWHGTGVVTTLGGIVDNGFGAAGTGGQVAVPMLYKYDLAAYAFDMGAGIQHAVLSGAQVINISAGYPCSVVTRVGPDFDLCSESGRAGICAVVSAAAHAAALIFCASPLAGIPIAGAIMCGVALGGATTATAACFSSLALGNVRAPMASAVRLATSRGVPVVTSAGNRMPPDAFPEVVRALLDLSESRTEVWGMIPAMIPDVVVVGAAREDNLGNEHFFGSRVDLWAPIPSRYFAPALVDDPASVSTPFSINGTSAAAPYVAGVIAAMQAANPSLDPVRATAAERATAVSRIRAILSSTAQSNARLVELGWLNDPVERRNLIDPLAAVTEAGRGVQPDLAALGYDLSLGFSEVDGTDDVEASAVPLSPGAPVAGTVFSFDPAAQDQDWRSFSMPTAAGRVFGANVVLRWVGDDVPTTSSAIAFPRVASGTVGVEKTATYRVVRSSGAAVRFAVSAFPGADVPYQVTLEAPELLAPTMAITNPVLLPGQTLCANQPVQFRATGTYPFTTTTVSAIEWRIDGLLQAASGTSATFTRPVGTDVFTATAFGATASLTVSYVTCAATAEILLPSSNVSDYGALDVNGPYLQLNFSGRAVDSLGATINPATLVFEWTTTRADCQPGAPATGSQLLGTGPSLSNVRIYGIGGSTSETHVITLTVRASVGGPVLSTDSIQVTVQNLI